MYVRASDGSGQERLIGGMHDGVATVEDWSPDGRRLLVDRTKFLGPRNWHSTLQVLGVEEKEKQIWKSTMPSAESFRPTDVGSPLATVPAGRSTSLLFLAQEGGSHYPQEGDMTHAGVATVKSFLTSRTTRRSSQSRCRSRRTIHVLSSQSLFHLSLPSNVGFYDVTRDGKRFLVNTRTLKEQAAPLTVVTNWSAQFKDESIRENRRN